MTGRVGRVVAILACLAVVSGCQGDDDLAHSPEVAQARESARSRATALVDRVTRGSSVLGRGEVDWCDAGHSNWKSTSAHKLRCGVEHTVLLDPDGDLAASTAALSKGLREAGCTPQGALSGDEKTIAQCDDGWSLVVLPLSSEREIRYYTRAHPPLPDAQLLTDKPLPESSVGQGARAKPVARLVVTSREYANIPR